MGAQVETISPGDGRTFRRTGAPSRVARLAWCTTWGCLKMERNSIPPGTETSPLSLCGASRRWSRGWEEGICPDERGSDSQADYLPRLCLWCHWALGIIPPNATLIFDVELLKLEWQEWPPPWAPHSWMCHRRIWRLQTHTASLHGALPAVPLHSLYKHLPRLNVFCHWL